MACQHLSSQAEERGDIVTSAEACRLIACSLRAKYICMHMHEGLGQQMILLSDSLLRCHQAGMASSNGSARAWAAATTQSQGGLITSQTACQLATRPTEALPLTVSMVQPCKQEVCQLQPSDLCCHIHPKSCAMRFAEHAARSSGVKSPGMCR